MESSSSSSSSVPSTSVPQSSVPRFVPFDHVFNDSYDNLGPVPMGDSVDWNHFSILCLEKLVRSLEVGNLVALPDGSWIKDFLVDAIFIVIDMGPQGALLDRVWRGPDMENMELLKARELASQAAVQAGRVGEDGTPVLPIDISPGNFYIPLKVLLGHSTKVFALNSAGLTHVREGGMGPGYVVPVDVVPTPVKWVATPEIALSSPLGGSLPSANPGSSIQLVMPANSYPPPSYKTQQSMLALQSFKLMVGSDMFLYDHVVSNLTTIDTNCAQRLAMRPNISDFMRTQLYVANPKLLIALMSANFSFSRDPLFTQISLLEFSHSGSEWSEVGSFWDDMLQASWVLDNLFRSAMPSLFTNLFSIAYQALNQVTLDMSASSKFNFVKAQMYNLWLRFGLFIKNQKLLLGAVGEFDQKCLDLFSFKDYDLVGKLQTDRNLGMDRVILDHANNRNKRGRSNDPPEPGGRGKKPVPGVPVQPRPKGNKPPKGFCMNYYAFLAKAPYHSGGLYPDCSNNPKCCRFCHVAVSPLNKVAIGDVILGRYADARVKVMVERYLATF